MLQCVACVAVCCAVVQGIDPLLVARACQGNTVCVLQCVAMCCNVLQFVAVCCSVLPCVALCCSVFLCVAVCAAGC